MATYVQRKVILSLLTMVLETCSEKGFVPCIIWVIYLEKGFLIKNGTCKYPAETLLQSLFQIVLTTAAF